MSRTGLAQQHLELEINMLTFTILVVAALSFVVQA